MGSNNQPLANVAVTISISGANQRVDHVVTDGKGTAHDSYTATAPGTDIVTASYNGMSSTSATVLWIKTTTVIHPIIVVHGFNENAADYAVQLDHNLPAGVQPSCTNLSCESWGPLLVTLGNLYPNSAIETLCYRDDKAWNTAPGACHDAEPIPNGSGSGSGTGPLASHIDCSVSNCESEGSVFLNAKELSQMVRQLNQQTGKPVTLIGYSMGGAIIRTFLAICQIANADPSCTGMASDVDQAIFLNAAHQGAWFLQPGADAMQIPDVNNPVFQSVLPFFIDAIKQLAPIDPGSQAIQDLKPQSPNIRTQNSSQDPTEVKFANFSSDISLSIGIKILPFMAPGTAALPLGDLVMLNQDGTYNGLPQYGGEEFCPGCPATFSSNGYRSSTQSQEWQVSDAHSVMINDIVNDSQAFKTILNSPISHLNISQPPSLEPTTSIRVYDSTGLWGNQMVAIPQEVLALLYKSDGLTFNQP